MTYRVHIFRPISEAMSQAPLYMLCYVCFLITYGCQQRQIENSGASVPSHDEWTVLLKKHVDNTGKVSYRGFVEDKAALESYLDLLSAHPPDREAWNREEQIAYWINAYNAFTVKLIVDNYPLKSITELRPLLNIPMINTVWHKKFFKIGGKDFSLDRIEHKILRKEFDEPRIHFGINCASYSCPPLRNEAYLPDRLNDQLEDQAKVFINDERWNRIENNSAEISRIFNWFEGDFTRNSGLISYLNKYSKIQLKNDARISYTEYDWRLNE